MLPATPVVPDQDGGTQQSVLRATVLVCSTESNHSPSSVYLRSQQAASAAPSSFQLAASPASLRHHCSRLPIACIHAADAACPSAATEDLSPRLLGTVPHALRRLRCMSAQAESVCCDEWVHTHRACKHVLRIGRTLRLTSCLQGLHPKRLHRAAKAQQWTSSVGSAIGWLSRLALYRKKFS